MAYGTVNADVIGTSVAGSNLGAGNASIMKNRIINGAMVIAQRGTTAVSSGSYPVDRFIMVSSSAATITTQQSATVPSASTYQNSTVITVTTGAASGASDREQIYQRIEGYNIADLGWGTANAKTVTLSFWAYASLAGTYSASFSNSAQTRSYVASYTLAASTWTQVSLTVAGDTSGTWLTTTGIGIQLSWDFGSGSTYTGTANTWSGSYYLAATGQATLSATTGATFYITGVQLEVGSSATGFEYRQYGQELALCQRYFFKSATGGTFGSMFWQGYTLNTSVYYTTAYLPVTMRATPTGAYATATQSGFNGVIASLDASATMLMAGETANATGTASYYGITYTASAEL